MRDPIIPLDARLFEHPYEFDFFQAVRLLHLMQENRQAVGRIAAPGDEPVRFKMRQSLTFPPSSIYSLSAEADPPQMTVAFMGLTGVKGILPHHYTVHILNRGQAGDFAMAAFFDIFNHRILSLFYRAWEKHRFPVCYQLAHTRGQSDKFTGYLFGWIGLGTARLQDRMSLPDQALLRYAGLLGQSPASTVSLKAILRDYFRVDVEIEEYLGAWYTLREADLCDLGGTTLNSQLGEGAIAGDAVWDPQARFRVRIGPLPLDSFLSFMPGSQTIRELGELVRFYVGAALQFDVQLVLKAGEVPWARLGDESPAGPRLGLCGWLKTGEFPGDATDAVFSV
jgi:type VI secretion system protein ImpH